jgi:hypothetical protein
MMLPVSDSKGAEVNGESWMMFRVHARNLAKLARFYEGTVTKKAL